MKLTLSVGGLPGVGIASAVVNTAGRLILTMSNGSTIDTGSVIAPGSGSGSAPTIGALAAAGSTQDTAAVVANQITIVTSLSAGNGIQLTAMVMPADIRNRAGGTIEIWPPDGEQLDGAGGINLAITLANGDNASFSRLGSSTPPTWYY